MNIQQFDYSVNLLQAIIWQYDEATNTVGLITQKNNWYNVNQTEFWTNWYNNVFNLLTADLFGLSVWSIILNLPQFLLAIPEPSNKPIWGFNAIVGSWPTLENSYLNFGQTPISGNTGGNFSTRGSNIILTEEEQRFALRLRYYQLCNRGDVTDVNQFLNYLTRTSNIGWSGTIYMIDNLDMTITYHFTVAAFPSDLLTTIQTYDLLPRPAGVTIIYS
jgi:Protein of unknown function (DUF2612)